MESNITVILISVWCVILSVCLFYIFIYSQIYFLLSALPLSDLYTHIHLQVILVFDLYNSNVM